ncbi:MAG: hypothetical protein K6E70_08765 [Butyrivibrio sp.]|nr:hypothetical protein [Butyrivibrio sp.]
MDRLVYYKKALEKNPAYNRAIEKCMEELVTIPSFANINGDPASVRKVGSIIHYLHTWAPVLTEFAAWVLGDAREKKVKKLYFLSRDAWPVYRAALELKEAFDDGGIKSRHDTNGKSGEASAASGDKNNYPELKYLRVSRYALRIPEMAIDNSHFLDMMFLSGIDVTMRKILQRGALSEEEMKEFVGIIGFTDSLDRLLKRPEIMQWKAEAEAHKDLLWTIVQKHARKRLPDTIGYLRQEGMLSEDNMAVVDSGWVGTTQRSIKKLLNYEKPGTKLSGYYFGLYEVPKDMDQDSYKSFYFGPKGHIRRKVYFSNCLFEAVSSEASGMTLGYRKIKDEAGERTEYKLTDSTNHENKKTGRRDKTQEYKADIAEYGSLNSEYLETMAPFLEMYAKAYARNRELDNGISVSEDILSKLMAAPDKWEAELYGKLEFCDDVLEGDAQDIAAKLPYKDICNLRLFRKTVIWLLSKLHFRTPDIHESGWIYGSIVRCGKHVRWSLMQARIYNYLMYIRKTL